MQRHSRASAQLAAASRTPRPRRTLALEIFKPARHALSSHPPASTLCLASVVGFLSCRRCCPAPHAGRPQRCMGCVSGLGSHPMLRNVDPACANPPVSVSAAVHSISYDVQHDVSTARHARGRPRCMAAAVGVSSWVSCRSPPPTPLCLPDEAEPPFGGSLFLVLIPPKSQTHSSSDSLVVFEGGGRPL